MIKWMIPNVPVDPDVLDRLRSHFPLPSKPPPFAWFMGDIHWMTWLVETDPNAYSVEQLQEAMREIRVGLLCFPHVDEVLLWKAWFHALLPYTLRQIDRDTLQQTPYSDALRACALIYPTQIDEVYPGFRRDLLNTLGTRGIPLTLSRDRLDGRSTNALITPILNDIWDLSNAPNAETPGMFEWFADPMAFCLRYLDADEMRGWVQSIPGTMADVGYVVRGKGSAESLNSASHGGGRQMSRSQAKKIISPADHQAYLSAHGVTLIGGGLDEAPQAYKRIETVMAAQHDLVEVVGTFQPKLVRMADDTPPWKKQAVPEGIVDVEGD